MTVLQPPAVPLFVADPTADAVAVMNTLVRDPLTFLLAPPVFRATRSGALTVAENVHQYVAWDNVIEDTYTGWSGGSATRYTVQAAGWYQFRFLVSLSGTGAANMAFVGSIAVNGSSHTGISGGAGWEGTYHAPPTGGTGQPKTAIGSGEVYCNVADYIQIDLFYTTESAMTAVDTTAGWQCSLELCWAGV